MATRGRAGRAAIGAEAGALGGAVAGRAIERGALVAGPRRGRDHAGSAPPPRGPLFVPPIDLISPLTARRLSPEQVGFLATVESWVIDLQEAADAWPYNLFDLRRLLWRCFPERPPEVVDLILATLDLVVEARLNGTDEAAWILAAYRRAARHAGGGLAAVMPVGATATSRA